MSLELIGKIVTKFPEQGGVSAKGPWKKQDILVETVETYPKKVVLTCWKDQVDQMAGISEGTMIKAQLSIESREFNSRWYTDVRAWKIEEQGGSSTQNTSQGNFQTPTQTGGDQAFDDTPADDDLPF